MQRQRLQDRFERARDRRRVDARRGSTRPVEPSLPDLSHVYTVVVPADEDLELVLEDLRADPHVAYVQRDHRLDLDQSMPPFDDPFLSSEGSWGQPYADLWGLDQIRATEAWRETLGEGTVVAVVDTGLDRFHPDIADNVWVNPGEDLNGDGIAGPEDENGLDDDQNGFIDDLTGFNFADSIDADRDGYYDGPDDVSDPDPFDTRGHGTHVAGTIGAVADNGIGIVGVAPGTRIMALKGFPAEGSAKDSVLWRAVLYAAENGATVINNSWSCGVPCPVNPLAEEVLELVHRLGSVVVTSAGNKSQDVVFRVPESGNAVLTVGALGQDEFLAGFSNRGWGLDVVAPGGGPNEPSSVPSARRNILSLLTSAIDPEDEFFSVDGPYWRLAGTSMSSPHVAGAVALLRSVRPDLTVEEVRRLVRMNAIDLGLPGHDPIYGAGMLDLPALLSAELPDLDLRIDGPPPGSLHDPAKGPIDLLGVASGGDLERVEYSVAKGLYGRAFMPIDPDEARNRIGRGKRPNEQTPRNRLVSWDIDEVEDGPYVMRARAFLFDGRVVDEYVVLGVERSAPVRVSGGELRVGQPTVSGQRIVWPVAEGEEAGAPLDLDGNLTRAHPSNGWHKSVPPEPRSKPVLREEGNQEDASLDGRNLVFRSRLGTETSLGWCRVRNLGSEGRGSIEKSDPPKSRCDSQTIETSEGFVSAPIAGGGWFVWQRDDPAGRVIEGCRVGRSARTCEPQPLIEDDGSSRWTLRSFDGENLLLQGRGRTVLCAVHAMGGPCTPEEIVRAPGTPTMTEPVHDGRLLAFRAISLELQPPIGCLPGEITPACPPSLQVIVRIHACELDAQNQCASFQISESARVEDVTGLRASGRRILWSMASESEEPSIRFCEFQPRTRDCTAQRVTGSLARQDDVAIDGPRLVWRDSREGEVAIFSYVVPDLLGQEAATTRAGKRFSIPLRAQRGTASSLTYSVSAIEGIDPEGALASVFDPGLPGGRVFLRGTMPEATEGVQVWRVRAESEGGLASEWDVEVRVEPATNAVGRNWEWIRRVLQQSGRGQALARMLGL